MQTNNAIDYSDVPEQSLFLESFIEYFWDTIVPEDEFVSNWHISKLCETMEDAFWRVVAKEAKEHDYLINVPPGTTKSTIVTKMFPVWAWINTPWMSFITGSHNKNLSLDHASKSQDVINSDKFKEMYGDHIRLRYGHENITQYQIEYNDEGKWKLGGERLSTSVGAKITGFHAHMIIVDDPIDPKSADAVSGLNRETANNWIGRTLSSRKKDKAITPIIMIMQRLHQDDPAGNWLSNEDKEIYHINLPGELVPDDPHINVIPKEWEKFYVKGLLDPDRLSREILKGMLPDLGQYGYAGQVLQNPVPPGGGMFNPDNLIILTKPPGNPRRMVTYIDKAGTEGGGAFTVILEMWEMKGKLSPKYIITKILRGQWGSDKRESIIQNNAQVCGRGMMTVVEQEPGSGGKESAEATKRNLALVGCKCKTDRPTGDKVYRADPFSVQVNQGNVGIVMGPWLKEFMEEMRFFPFSKFKDQIDSGSGAFNYLFTGKRIGAY